MATWILLVDDDVNILSIVSQRLEMEGYSVTTASDAMQATIQAETLRPKLVIMDMQMPGFGTGADAIRAMRAHPRLKSIPIVVFTGMDLDKAKAMLPPNDKLLRVTPKPLDWPLMKRTLDELLAGAPPGDGPSPGSEAVGPGIAGVPSAAAAAPSSAQGAKKILIIEDEETFFQAMQEAIERSDSVFWAKNGLEALEQLKALRPDLILLDLVMPKMTGIEFLRAVQGLPSKSIPVVLMTGTHMAPKQVELMGKDFPNLRFVIEKPCRIQNVRQVIDYLLGRGPLPGKPA